MILKQLFAFLKLLNSDVGTTSISFGVVCGLFLGLTPAFSPQTILVMILLFMFRIQIGAAFIAAFAFAMPAYLLDGVFHIVGKMVLEVDAFQGIYTTMYNMPIVPFSKFNNSVVMGSFVVAIFLSPFIFFITKYLVNKYRELVVARIKGTKLFKALQTTSLYKWYYKYNELY